MSRTFEVNFDGLVGTTHNHAGLSHGNIASYKNADLASSPKKAALQGLEKMKALADLGAKQAVLPPQERPHISTLRRLGFSGKTDAHVLSAAAKQAPELLPQICSASSMWTANAATVSPFPDTMDGKTHFTVANLSSMFHRSIEAESTSKLLRKIFCGDEFQHHHPLPASGCLSDEGAANHTRLCAQHGEAGVELFVYGAHALNRSTQQPQKFPARQTLEASQTVVRYHQLHPERTVLAQQNPKAIDAGVFHNDVIALGHLDVLFYHEQAFLETERVLSQLQLALGQTELHPIRVPSNVIPLEHAVSSYLFNSQLIERADDIQGLTLVVPKECQQISSVNDYLQTLCGLDSRISHIAYVDLRQSMRNGGGPACLRLRVVMSEQQIKAMKARVFLDQALYNDLKSWIHTHYRDTLLPADLADPALLLESRTALDELSNIMALGSIFEFQQT